MPRKHQRQPASRKYMDYTEETLLSAIADIQKGVKVKDASALYNIPLRTLWYKLKRQHSKPAGGQTVLSRAEEDDVSEHLLQCADFGMPLEKTDIKMIVKGFLDKCGRSVRVFNDNLPGDDWVAGFLKRQKDLTTRMCQNIKRPRAQVTPDAIKVYFSNLETSLYGVPPSNILNYDETNLADEPGAKKCIFRRGVKYPERIMNHSKGNISVMFAGTAAGEILPPFVIYKSKGLWESWCSGGPPGTRFGRSKSGWMDSNNFEEWFLSIIVPWARRLEGKKVIIGDNLSSHLSATVIDKCAQLDIGFVLLPPNSTDKCQPLDVAFFGPMKREWRKIIENYKLKHPSSTSLDKSIFPRLLDQLMTTLGMRSSQNIVSGFKACGIHPLNRDTVLKKFPSPDTTDAEDNVSGRVSAAVLEYLQQFKYSPGGNKSSQRCSRKKISLEPGKSITAADLNNAASTSSTISSTGAHARCLASTSSRSSPAPQALQEELLNSDSDSSYVASSEDEWEPPAKKDKRRN